MSNPLAHEVRVSFYEEARGYLPAMRDCLEALRNSPTDQPAAGELHRCAHNLRGASHVIGIPEIAQITEGVEALMEQVAAGEVSLDGELIELLGQALDQVALSLKTMDAPPADEDKVPAEPRAVTSGVSSLGAELLDGFLIEAEEHLQTIGPWLRELEEATGNKPLMQDVRRSVHTIKGAAAMVGLGTVSKVAHRMEDLLDRLYEDTVSYSNQCRDLLYGSYDLLAELIRARGNAQGLEPAIDTLFDRYTALLASAGAVVAPEVAFVPAVSREGPATEEFLATSAASPDVASEAARLVRVPIEQLDQLTRLVGEMFVQQSVFERMLKSCRREVNELDLTRERLRRLGGQMEAAESKWLPAAIAQVPEALAAGHPEFDALEFDRYTQLHLIARDLAETGSDLLTAGAQLRELLGGFQTYLTQQERFTSDVQDKLMRLRLVPLSTLENRLHSVVRMTAGIVGKQAELKLEGAETELDKKVLEELAGPLEHLLRNAVDHGIEHPEYRAAAGKPGTGRILLRASREGTDVVVRLSDDGRGLNEDRLRSEAVAQGYAATGSELSNEQLFSLVFEPGFSTAEHISEISGRGVGLDVVRAAVESFKGTLTMDSQRGKGVTFTLRLPMTLAIAKVLLVQVHREVLALPLQSVIQAARVEPRQIEETGSGLILHLGSKPLRVLDLARTLGTRESMERKSGRLPVVVLQVGDEEFAVLVDRILEAREVAVKPLGGLLRRTPAVAGATILGDGSVVLILNPAELIQGHGAALPRVERRLTPVTQKPLDVLIVDDSLSVRRIVANLIRTTGWNPVQAKDGIEAIEILETTELRPDVILMDVEMPRMDGFELTERLRARADFRRTPIIMLTSRAGDKHRNKAMACGVNEYLVKPYQDDVLLATIRRVVAEARRAVA